jgi:hypothetical protein
MNRNAAHAFAKKVWHFSLSAPDWSASWHSLPWFTPGIPGPAIRFRKIQSANGSSNSAPARRRCRSRCGTTGTMIRVGDPTATRAPDQLIGLTRETGYYHIAAEQLIRLRDHGVMESYIKSMKAKGYNDLTLDDLVRMRDRGRN